MYNLLLTALLVLSVILVIAIFMQPQKILAAMYLTTVVQKLCLKEQKRVDLKRLCNVLQRF